MKMRRRSPKYDAHPKNQQKRNEKDTKHYICHTESGVDIVFEEEAEINRILLELEEEKKQKAKCQEYQWIISL